MRVLRGLRARLAVRAALLAAVALAGVVAVVETAFVRPLGDRLDDDLASRVEGLRALVREGGAGALRRHASAWPRSGTGEWALLRHPRDGVLATLGRTPPPGAEGLEAPVKGSFRALLRDAVDGAWRVETVPVAAPGSELSLTLAVGVSLEDVLRDQRDLRILVAAAALGGVLLVAAGAWFGAGLVLDPLGRMTEAARRAPADGSRLDLPVRAEGDEFDDLARLLNDLVSRVGGALEEERRFAGEAAHELRAPLSVLRIRAEEALESGDPEERRQALEGVLADCDRVARLVQALLELARAAPAAGAAPAPPVPAGETLAALAGDLATLAAARGLILSFADRTDGARVAAPREVLETAVSVLVDNALRYGAEGKEVHLEADAADGSLRVRVRDGGPGVPAEEAGRVFDRLFRGKTGRASGSGFGLGLALARRLARSAGGEVLLENPGRPGASFVVRLPLAP